MNFLAPLFLLGGLAVGLPIIFHLIRRTTRDKTPFSSLMFLAPTPPRITRRSRLENIWLLLLRCLILALVAMAFARPFFEKPLAALPDASRGKRVVVLLDMSASMRREDLWPAAKEKVEAFLGQAAALDEISLTTFDTASHPLITFDEWSRMTPGERAAIVHDRLNAAVPSWAATELGNALINAVETLDEADKREEKAARPRERQIFLVTDLQGGSRLQTLQAFEWPRGVVLTVEQVKPKRPTNASLQLVVENEESAPPGTELGPRVRVSNASDSDREQFELRWADLNEASVKPAAVYVPPGQSRIVRMPLITNVSATATAIVLSGDDQDFDNKLFLVQPKPEQVVLPYFGSEQSDDSSQPLYYLLKAFQKTRRQIVEVVQVRSDSTYRQDILDRARLAVVADAPADAGMAALQEFIKQGRTALLLLKSPAAATTLARLAGTDALMISESPNKGYAMFAEIDFEHPLFAPFADPRFSDFTKLHFWKHRKLDLATLPNARSLARFDDGDVALAEIPVGQGRILVLTSGWQPAESQLALSSKFVPLLYSILEQSGDAGERTPQYLVGENVSLHQSGTNQTGPIKLQKPDRTTIDLQSSQKIAQTDLPGIYALSFAHATQHFAVNLDPSESRTASLSTDDLEKFGVTVKNTDKTSNEKLQQKRVQLHHAELESRQKLWRWFIVAALLLLMAETIFAGALTRRSAAIVSA